MLLSDNRSYHVIRYENVDDILILLNIIIHNMATDCCKMTEIIRLRDITCDVTVYGRINTNWEIIQILSYHLDINIIFFKIIFSCLRFSRQCMYWIIRTILSVFPLTLMPILAFFYHSTVSFHVIKLLISRVSEMAYDSTLVFCFNAP